jgi:hypothetical protein
MEPQKAKKPPILYARFVRSAERPGMVAWLIKEKWVKTDREAVSILLLVVFIALSGTLFFSYYPNPPKFFTKNFEKGYVASDRWCDQNYGGNAYNNPDCFGSYKQPR